MDSKTSSWILGAAFLALVTLVGGWFLAISPALATASEAQAEEQSVQDQNFALTTKLIKLKDQFEHLDESKADIAALETQIPTTAELSTFLRTIDSFAQARGAYTVAFAAPTPVSVVPAIAVAPAEAATAATSTDAAATDTAATETAAADAAAADAAVVDPAAAVIAGFVAIPIDITMLGTVSNVTAFLTDLQTKADRLYLVTTFTGAGQDAKEATGGRPAIAQGDIELTISGFMYVLEDTTAVVEDSLDGTLPSPTGDTSPFDAQ